MRDVIMVRARRTTARHVWFPTVDALKREFTTFAELPGCRLRQIGESRQREPLALLSIGDGPRHALIVAGVHPNEPVGFHSVIVLAGLLSETRALTDGWTWHVVPVLDPDGARLNRWYQRRPTVPTFYRESYRPVAHQQPAATFPLTHGQRRFDATLPETRALMRVIEETDPALVVELHNSHFEGTWFAVNQRVGVLADRLRSAARSTRLELADEPIDMHAYGWGSDGPGVRIAPRTPSAVQTQPDVREPLSYGASLWEYLDRSTLYVGPEVPLWRVTAPRPPSGDHRLALNLIAQQADHSADVAAWCLEVARPALTVETPFRPAAEMALASARRLARRAREWCGEVTAGHYAGVCYSLHMSRLRAAGMLRRMLEDERERARGNVSPAIREVTGEVEKHFDECCAACEAALRPQPSYLPHLVCVQVEAAVLSMRYLDEVRTP